MWKKRKKPRNEKEMGGYSKREQEGTGTALDLPFHMRLEGLKVIRKGAGYEQLGK